MLSFAQFVESSSENLPVTIHKSPYEGAEGEYRYTTMFMGGISAQDFAKFVISKGGKAKIGKRGQDFYVYHTILVTKQDFARSKK